jgi:hypothetical protein
VIEIGLYMSRNLTVFCFSCKVFVKKTQKRSIGKLWVQRILSNEDYVADIILNLYCYYVNIYCYILVFLY